MPSYKSSTTFDKNLILEINENNDGRKTNFVYKGFDSMDQAKDFAKWWEDCWYYGYMGDAVATISSQGNIVVMASRYNSCD